LRIGVDRLEGDVKKEHRLSLKLCFAGLSMWVLALGTGQGFGWPQVTGSISGTVEDRSGAAVGGATVAVKSLDMGLTRTVRTDEAGHYLARSLPVGPHEVRAEARGFKGTVRTGINLQVGQQAV